MDTFFILSQVVDSTTEAVSYGVSFAKMLMAMVFIICLAFFVLKYLLPKMTIARRNRDSQIKVLDYQPLEARKGIYLIQIHDRKLAVGVCDNSMSPLCEWRIEGETK